MQERHRPNLVEETRFLDEKFEIHIAVLLKAQAF
jgi:hypothetical protein